MTDLIPAVDFTAQLDALGATVTPSSLRFIGGEQILVRFPNGYGMSLVRGGIGHYAGDGTVESAAIHWTGPGARQWEFARELDDQVRGWQTPEDVLADAREIASWPAHEIESGQ